MFSGIILQLDKYNLSFFEVKITKLILRWKKLSCGAWSGENTYVFFFSFYLSPFSGLAIKEWLNAWLTSCKHASFQFPDKIPNPLSFMWEVIPRSNVSTIPPRQLRYLSFHLKSSNPLGSLEFHFYRFTYQSINQSIYLSNLSFITYDFICLFTQTQTDTHTHIFSLQIP